MQESSQHNDVRTTIWFFNTEVTMYLQCRNTYIYNGINQKSESSFNAIKGAVCKFCQRSKSFQTCTFFLTLALIQTRPRTQCFGPAVSDECHLWKCSTSHSHKRFATCFTCTLAKKIKRKQTNPFEFQLTTQQKNTSAHTFVFSHTGKPKGRLWFGCRMFL